MIANVVNSSFSFKGAPSSVRESFDNNTRKINEIAKRQNELVMSQMNGTNPANTANKTQARISMQGTGQKLDVIA